MYLLTVGVILDNVSVIEIDSDNALIADLVLDNDTLIDTDSDKVLKNETTLAKLSLIDVFSVNVLLVPCCLASKSVITISPPLTVSKTFESNTALSNLVRYSTISTVLWTDVSNTALS